MFYVLNQDNQIVAADYDLLEILESNNLQTLFVQVATGEISFEKVNDRKINIQSSNSSVTASHEEYVLKTTFGDLTLVKLYNIIVKSGYSSTMDESPQKEAISEPLKDIRPTRTASIFADDEEQATPKPRRASIFIEDEEETATASTPKQETQKEEFLSDIANKKVQSDLFEASQKLKDEKIDKKPTLETLHDEDKEFDNRATVPTQKSSVVDKVAQAVEEDLHLDELSVEDTVSTQEPEKEEKTTHAFEDDLKLAGIDLEEKDEDDASIDELLALADEQENAQKESVSEAKEEEPTIALDEEEFTEELTFESDAKEEELNLKTLGLDEEESSLALDEESLEELSLEAFGLDDEEPALAVEESEEPTLAFEEEEPLAPALAIEEEESEEIGDLLLSDEEESKEELSIDEGLLLSDDEEIEEIGDLLLSDDEEPVREEPKPEPIEEIEEIGDLLLSDDEEPLREEKKEEVVEEVEEFDDLLMLDDEPKKEIHAQESKVEEEIEEFDDLLMLDDEKPAATKESPKEEVDEIKDLLSEIDDEPKIETVPETPKVVKKPVKSYEYPDTIEIDLDEYGEMIGLGAEDYTEFLNEFIDKSIIYDENLRSEDKDAREEALNELYSISQSLQLPHLDEILEDMLDRDYLEEELVDIYFDCLAKVTTTSKPQESPKSADIFEDEPKIEEPVVEEPKAEEALAANASGYGTLSFEGIKPIHFDFRLEEAAEDLSLPVDLIEEFVNDFIDQAIEEKETFIKAYAEGDMDTIQKTGHKLKGASSNLRIIPLSETLEEIQHNDNPARFEPLLKKYWGQFLSFKLFMENISH